MLDTKIPVLTSLYHIELWPEFLDVFIKNKHKIVPILGLCEDNDNSSIIKDLSNNFENYDVVMCKNAGADVMPFLTMLKKIDCGTYPFFIKIHAKKSNWGSRNHVNWRRILINDLLSDIRLIDNNIKLFDSDKVGMICNKFLCLDHREFTNTGHIKTICSLLNIKYDKVKNSAFPAGNMFMSKTSIFKKYFNDNISDIIIDLLQYEIGKITDVPKGTYSHALERIFGYIIKYENKKMVSPAHRTIKILNKQKDKNHYFHLVKIHYDNSCYVQEDINIYGLILEDNDHNMIIKWKHLANETTVEYKKISNKVIVKHKIL